MFKVESRQVFLCLWTSERTSESSLFCNEYRRVISSLVVHSHIVLSIKYRWVKLSLVGKKKERKRKSKIKGWQICEGGSRAVKSHEYWGTGLFVYFLLVNEMNCKSVCGYFFLVRSVHMKNRTCLGESHTGGINCLHCKQAEVLYWLMWHFFKLCTSDNHRIDKPRLSWTPFN